MIPLHNLFVCPRCKQKLEISTEAYKCRPCNKDFPILNGIPTFMTSDAESDSMNSFWDKGWENRLENTDQQYLLKESGQELTSRLQANLVDLKAEKDTIADVSPKDDEILLNVGCGTGEAPLFTAMGFDQYIGLDYSYNATKYSQELIKKMGGNGITIQANAELLPIASNSIDIIYSNGVLHHTPETVKAISEAVRVLKPSGKGIIGLYSKYSPIFINFRLHGTLKSIFSRRYKAWYAVGEGAWQTGDLTNPWTKTYSLRELKKIFSQFPLVDLNFRKAGFSWGNTLPKLGKYLDNSTFGRTTSKMLHSKFGGMWVITFKKG